MVLAKFGKSPFRGSWSFHISCFASFDHDGHPEWFIYIQEIHFWLSIFIGLNELHVRIILELFCQKRLAVLEIFFSFSCFHCI